VIPIATMEFQGFGQADFDAMQVEGLEGRMQAIIEIVRPKLESLGETLAPVLSRLCGEPMHPHVAKHARRSVHPPADTWVAWSRSPRGYKMLPHFQVGIWPTHLFMQFAIIYECPNKNVFAEHALRELDSIRQHVPAHFIWSRDHTLPHGSAHSELSDRELADWLQRLHTVKSAEITCGIHINRHDDLLTDGAALLQKAADTFETLLPLYRMAGN